jgi:hypothetical protein
VEIEQAYGTYSDVNNLKNKKEYDEEIALHELQPNKYSNEDQLNMTSSTQSETSEPCLKSELCDGKVEIEQLKPWNHLEPSANKVEPTPLPVKCACNKFNKVVKSKANFEDAMNLGKSSVEGQAKYMEDKESDSSSGSGSINSNNENQEQEESLADKISNWLN